MSIKFDRFDVLVVAMKINAFCGVTAYSLVQIYELLGEPISCMCCPKDGNFVTVQVLCQGVMLAEDKIM